jgi:hypothetical protein
MHWLKWLVEIWMVCGVVTVVVGLILTTRVNREMSPDINKVEAASERSFGAASLWKNSA